MTTTMTTMDKDGKPSKTQSEMDEATELQYCIEDVNDFLTLTADARALSEKCRDYYDGKQWSAEQLKEMKRRKQAAIVSNRIKVKQNGLLGLFSIRKGDPKAYPRNQVPSDEGGAEAATDALTYITERNQYNLMRMRLADNFFCEGYCAALITEQEMPDGSMDVNVEDIPWDRIFFDPHSRKHDFSDARYKGYMLWMYEDDILDQFEDAEDVLAANVQLATDNTFEDKPRWFDGVGRTKRHLVATKYYKKAGEWYVVIYTAGGFLMKKKPSPYTDEFGNSSCPLELAHAYITRDGDRKGELADYLDLQDEVNHRRSKALFLLSARQTFSNRGAVDNVAQLKRELAKPDGHIEVKQGELNKDFGVLPTNDMAQGQLTLLQEAKSEIDSQGYNAQLAGERQMGDLSGVAIGKLQNSGSNELNILFDNLFYFELRIYRQIWCRVRQFWTEEKWVRVTDDQDSLRFVGFNVPVTMKDALQETMDNDALPHEMRLGASAKMIELEQVPGALDQVIEVKNRPSELDMDIILDQSYDVVNTSQEQLNAILQYGAQNQFDLIDLLDISSIRHKDKLIERLENRKKEAAEAAAQAGPDPQAMYLKAKASEAEANVEVKKQDAQQTAIENQLLQQNQVVPFKGTVSA